MRLKGSTTLAFATAAVALMVPAMASAQPDARLLRPNIMVLLDSSGSMEFALNGRDNDPACARADGGSCIECAPGVPQCSGSCPTSASRNRWITAIEVLTGSIQGYSCLQTQRTDTSQYDYQYTIPHHEPRSNGFRLFEAGAMQSPDGILDVYSDRVRFGLMTADTAWQASTNVDGMFSYAENTLYGPPLCLTPATWNLGVKRASIDNNVTDVVPGGLISVGAPSADTATLALINRQLQESLTGRAAIGLSPAVAGVRPLRETPIDAMLDDALYYWRNNPDVVDGTTGTGDPYYRCRNRANILITDGAATDPIWRSVCRGGAFCPYVPATATAMTMSMPAPTGPNVRTYVIAFDRTNADALATLDPIRIAGNTSRVFFADDRPTFAAALSEIIDNEASATSTRVPPVYGASGVPSAIGAPQYQFSSSFTVTPGQPWSGSLTRSRTVCESPSMGAPPVPTDKPIDAALGDDFGYNLRASYRASQPGWGSRYLWTFVPSGAATSGPMMGSITNATSGSTGFVRDLPSLASTPGLYSYSTVSEVNTLLAWLRGDPGTIREFRPLGDIYRSTPVNVQAPLLDLPDQSFTAYRSSVLSGTTSITAPNVIPTRRRVDVRVGAREPMLYVGTNDGILHAFNTDSGEEAWGFVPPYILPSLRTHYPSTRAFGVDGTPVVKEVVFQRSASTPATAASWRTVLLVGLRNGGPAYEALDVTDPYQPRFLWQFTDASLVAATGTPAIGTLFYIPAGESVPVERAVAFIPGGAGRPRTTPACTPTSSGRPARNPILAAPDSGRGARRPYVRCWDTDLGQYFYVVDLQTGALIRKIGTGTSGALPTGSPLTGAPALYSGTSGTVATRAYVGDADGTLWRVDFSSRDPAQWWMSDEFDLYWGGAAYNAGQPIVERPTLTVGTTGELRVAFGSGDPEQLEDTTNEYRVASFTERTRTDSSGLVVGVDVTENWEIRPGADVTRDFVTGERLTGGMTLFNGVLYFGTFIPQSSATSPCDYGYARLWGIDISRSDVGSTYDYPRARLDLDGDPSTASDVVRVTSDLDFNPATDDRNSVLFGVAVTRRLSCNVTASAPDPITGTPRSYVSSSSGGDYRLALQTASAGRGAAAGLNPLTSRRLPRPQMPARIDSWASIFE